MINIGKNIMLSVLMKIINEKIAADKQYFLFTNINNPKVKNNVKVGSVSAVLVVKKNTGAKAVRIIAK
jgi:hypothetical protein